MISFSSERLRFRELHPEDISTTYINWMNDPSITQYLETRFVRQNACSIREFVTSQLARPDAFLIRIALAEDDSHIGNIKLGPINHDHKSAHISLLIGDRAHHGHGYGSEAIARVSRWGFEECGLYRIEGGCYAENLGSLRAFLKSGYVVEGFRRDAVISSGGGRQGGFWFARLATDKVRDA